MSLIALMIMAGKNPEQAAEEAEGLFQTMKKDYKISSDVVQSVAMVLSLSDKPVQQKLEGFFSLVRGMQKRKARDCPGQGDGDLLRLCGCRLRSE